MAREGGTTARGYGSAHQRRRKAWAPLVAAGEVACRRCGELIESGAGWDLGHVDEDRSLPSAPEHAACNRATAGRGPASGAEPAEAWRREPVTVVASAEEVLAARGLVVKAGAPVGTLPWRRVSSW